MPETSITWPQLVVLMTVGNAPDPALRGIVGHRDAVPVADDEPADLELGDVGRYRLCDGRLRVFKKGSLSRREHMDGRPLGIEGTDTIWVWHGDDNRPTAFPRRTASWGWPDAALTSRRELDGWRGDDFTRPGAPPTATTFLGREAWEVHLLPPGHKPFPLHLLVDAVTGLVLSQRNDGFRTVVEWEELELDVDLTDDLFAWDGPAKPPPDHRAEHEADMARRRTWLAEQGIGDVALTLPVEVMLHENSDDGAFHASLRLGLNGSLARRPHAEQPWELVMNWPQTRRWTADGWDWWLGTDDSVDDAVLDAIKAQLADRG